MKLKFKFKFIERLQTIRELRRDREIQEREIEYEHNRRLRRKFLLLLSKYIRCLQFFLPAFAVLEQERCNHKKYDVVDQKIQSETAELQIKSGDIMVVGYLRTKRIRFKYKDVFYFLIKWNFNKAGRLIRGVIRKRIRRQRLLERKRLFYKFWRTAFSLGRVIWTLIAKLKELLSLSYRVKRVLFVDLAFLKATNIIIRCCVKRTGKNFVRNALYFILNRFRKKMKRLEPLRKMHRKKRKNK